MEKSTIRLVFNVTYRKAKRLKSIKQNYHHENSWPFTLVQSRTFEPVINALRNLKQLLASMRCREEYCLFLLRLERLLSPF